MTSTTASRTSSPARAVPGGLRRIGLVLNPSRDVSAVVQEVLDWAAGDGVEVLALEQDAGTRPLGLASVPAAELAGLDLVLAIGGDGTMLQALRSVADVDVPVLGVAFGHLGYLTEEIAGRCGRILAELDAGQHVRRGLLALRAEVLGEEGGTGTAVNDLVLSRTAGQGQAFLSVEVDGSRFVRYSTDALVVATPLGSTAYSLSAGGPLAAPELDLLLLTPVAPQGVFDRTLLVPPAQPLEIEVIERSAPVVLEADGRTIATLQPGQRVRIEAAPSSATIVRLDGTSFYTRVRSRLLIPDAPVLAPARED